MNFREWLTLNEEENRVWPGSEKYKANTNNIDWDLVYPTTAGDYVKSVNKPKEFWWMQWEWERGSEIGRPLDNIDREVLGRRYVSLDSRTAPDDQTWRHKPDKESEGYLGVVKNIDLVRLGVGPSHKEPLILKGPRVLGHRMGSDPPFPPHSAANG